LSSERAVSSVLGMILVLVILGAVITVITVYKIPIIEKKSEFQHEVDLLDDFSNLRNIYYPESNSSSVTVEFDLGGSSPPLVRVVEDANLMVWNSGYVTYTITSTTSASYTTHIFAVNMSVYPSRLPYLTAVMSEGGLKYYQAGNRGLAIYSPRSYINGSVVKNSATNLTVYVDNYVVNTISNGNYTISGTGFVCLGIKMNERVAGTYTGATLTIDPHDSLYQNYWNAIKNKYTGTYNITVIYRNYTIDLW